MDPPPPPPEAPNYKNTIFILYVSTVALYTIT